MPRSPTRRRCIACCRPPPSAARRGRVVTFGMRPDAVETGYGYIEVGAALAVLQGVHEVARFIEKPDADMAAELVGAGRHLWNSGMFVFTARTLLGELERHATDVLVAARAAVSARHTDLDFIRLGRRNSPHARRSAWTMRWPSAPQPAAVVPADLGWSDVEAGPHCGNSAPRIAAATSRSGDVILENAENCYVRSDGMLAAVVGLSDAVVVVTEDAVLAMHRGHAQDVKKMVDRLKAPAGRRRWRTIAAIGPGGSMRADPAASASR